MVHETHDKKINKKAMTALYCSPPSHTPGICVQAQQKEGLHKFFPFINVNVMGLLNTII